MQRNAAVIGWLTCYSLDVAKPIVHEDDQLACLNLGLLQLMLPRDNIIIHVQPLWRPCHLDHIEQHLVYICAERWYVHAEPKRTSIYCRTTRRQPWRQLDRISARHGSTCQKILILNMSVSRILFSLFSIMSKIQNCEQFVWRAGSETRF